MTTPACPACGVKLRKRVGRCPACRAWLGRRQTSVRLAGALIAVIAACALIHLHGLAWTATPPLSVQITPAISLRSPDDRGTDAWATIVNPNPMPVDVTIRVRGFDITDRPHIEKTIGPFPRLPPGGSRSIQAYLDATPLKSVTFEAVTVNPADADRP
jgi:hypothetical protein